MLYVTLASIASTCLVTVAFLGVIRSQSRAAARREDLLVNQVCSLAGRPWQPPPAREPAPVLDDAELERWVTLPERLPD